MKQNSPWYRPDIDGLRAIAIFGVIALHFKNGSTEKYVQSGQLGVDIFFVISGFLITSIILRELGKKTFSLKNFWARRIRRIIPALTAVIIFTAGFQFLDGATFPYNPNYGESVVAQSFFVSNFYFFETLKLLGNTGNGAQTQPNTQPHGPLTHTWSLSVEEQFYLLFPFIFILLFRYARPYLFSVLFTMSAASFILYYYLWGISPQSDFLFSNTHSKNITAGFYLLPARAWELLVGALIALLQIRFTKLFAEIISLAGLTLIFFSFYYPVMANELHKVAPFGILGTSMIILANKDHATFAKKILSAKPLVWVGLISYSLYLWHWPLFVFTRHKYPEIANDNGALLILLFFTLTISALSYQYIERPFLENKSWTLKQVYLGGACATLCAASLGLVIVLFF